MNQFDGWTQLIANLRWYDIVEESWLRRGKDCHIVSSTFVHSSESEITNCQLFFSYIRVLAHAIYYFSFFLPANRAYSTLTRQLEAVVNEVWLRTTPLQVHEAKYLPPTKVTYSYTGFHNDQASYFKHEGTCICRTWAYAIL